MTLALVLLQFAVKLHSPVLLCCLAVAMVRCKCASHNVCVLLNDTMLID